MRLLSFVLVIIGSILCFSDTSVAGGVVLIVVGVILNWIYHLAKMGEHMSNHR